MTGFERAESYLNSSNVPADLRPAMKSEAHIRSNMFGHRYADAMWDVCTDWAAGRDWQQYTKRTAEILRAEAERRN